jgi:hypothetical protein
MSHRDEIHCVVCGESLFDENFVRNHHCDPQRESRIENARKSHDRAAIRQRQPEFRERLSVGFEMLAMAGDME